MDNLNTLFKPSQKRKLQAQMTLLLNFIKHLRIVPIQYKLSQKTKEERILPNSFHDANITLMPKQDKDINQK